MAKSPGARKAPPEYPISVRFPAALRSRTERYAREHRVAVASAIRMIVGEHLDELDRDEGLSRAELWQRAQAWSTAQSIVDGSAVEASWDELRTAARDTEAKRGRAKRSR